MEKDVKIASIENSVPTPPLASGFHKSHLLKEIFWISS